MDCWGNGKTMSERYGLEEYELSETCVCRVCGKDWYGKPGGWKWVDPRLCRDCAEKSKRIDEIRAEVERENRR